MANRIETGLQITGLSGDTNALYVVGNSLVNGDVNITGNVNIIGTATTLNTETVQTKDNRILLNYSGTSLSAIGGGIEVLSAKTDGSNTSLTTDINSDWNMNVGLNITGRTSDNTAYALKIKNSANTDTLLVRNDGNVGIGGLPIYADYKLQVLGDSVGVFGSDSATGATTSQYRFGSGQRFTNSFFENNSGVGQVDYFNSRVDSYFDNHRFLKKAGTEIMRVGDGGASTNVGIGTLGGATARLHVKGDGTGTTNAFLIQNSSNTEILSVRNDGRIFLNTDCNVGIGNNTPFNAVLGVDALDSYTGASNTGANVAVGYEALKLNLDGGYNTAVGYQSLRNTTGNQNTAVNFSLWQNTTGIRNTAVGYNNLNNSITQNYNSAFGVENLLNLTSGTGNIALSPYRTMYSLVSGSDNVGVGNHIMTYITGGSSNTVVGNLSLSNTNLLSSNSNTVVGAYNFTTNPTGSSLTFENNTIIGRGINNWADSISNHVVIGDGSGNIRILSNNTGNVGIGTVSPTSKLDITGSTGYNQLRLRTSFTPSGSTDTSGNVGDIAWDDTYFYWKTSSQWLRVSGSTWP